MTCPAHRIELGKLADAPVRCRTVLCGATCSCRPLAAGLLFSGTAAQLGDLNVPLQGPLRLLRDFAARRGAADEGGGAGSCPLSSDTPGAGAPFFTRNHFLGAPVIVWREWIRDGRLQAVVANSKISNLAAGTREIEDVRRMGGARGGELGVPEKPVLVSPTGLTGQRFRMGKIEREIRGIPDEFSDDPWAGVRKLLTTYTERKVPLDSGRLRGDCGYPVEIMIGLDVKTGRWLGGDLTGGYIEEIAAYVSSYTPIAAGGRPSSRPPRRDHMSRRDLGATNQRVLGLENLCRENLLDSLSVGRLVELHLKLVATGARGPDLHSYHAQDLPAELNGEAADLVERDAVVVLLRSGHALLVDIQDPPVCHDEQVADGLTGVLDGLTWD